MVQFEKTGFRVRARMESCDVIKYLNHVVQVGFARSLLAFRCPVPLERLKRGAVRVYHQGNGRWYRVEEEERCKASRASASGIEEPLGQHELPNELMAPYCVNVLLATLDHDARRAVYTDGSLSIISKEIEFRVGTGIIFVKFSCPKCTLCDVQEEVEELIPSFQRLHCLYPS